MEVRKEQTELVDTLEFIQRKIEGTITEYLDSYADYGWDSFAETLNNTSAQLHMMEVMLRNAKVKHDYMNR